ncbi:MAG: AAA family ATPase, partial [Anaerolineales bacterium]|nr:AAA family ATPase [Anaerolineales bacterium]
MNLLRIKSMKLIQVNIENFLGIEEKTSIDLSQFNVLIGRNDVGKSTVMKALDIFLNSVKPSSEQSSIFNDSGIISIEAIFEPSTDPIIIDENVTTSFEQEELVNEQGLLHIKKAWDTSKSSVSPEIYIIRKTYDENDFLPLTESQLISLCNDCEIKTRKANNAEYNNVEKRAKLREY